PRFCQDARRHAACRRLPPVAPLVASSGAPLCSRRTWLRLAGEPLTVVRTGRGTTSLRPPCQAPAPGRDPSTVVLAAQPQQSLHVPQSFGTSCARLTCRSPGTAALGVSTVNGRLAVPDKTPCPTASARGPHA